MAFDPMSTPVHEALRFIQGMSPVQTQANSQLDFSKAFEGMQNPGPYQTIDQAVDYGMKPVNGMVYKGAMAPGSGVNPMTGQMPDPKAAQNGSWEFIGNHSDSNSTGDGRGASQEGQWRYREAQPQAAPMQRQVQEEAPVQAAPTDGKTIYNDWDRYQDTARKTTEGYNYYTHVLDPAKVPHDQAQATQMLYPSAWQEGGVKPTIGPNGQNIAPYLNSDFGDPQFLDTTKKDMPSLVSMLLNSGNIDQRQSQALLDLMKPKKLDTSFAMTGMQK